MSETIPAGGRNAASKGPLCFIGLLVCTLIALAIAACGTAVAPATPVFISIVGHGHGGNTASGVQFRFDLPTFDAATGKSITHIGTTVRFSVPYPTSIELSINGTPLTKTTPPLSTSFEYAGQIENPGANPAIWSVDILTPFNVPFAEDPGGQVAYTLNIVDVSGAIKSQPLQIFYRQPQSPPIPGPVFGSVSSTHTTEPPSANRPTGPCPGGAQTQEFDFCWTKANVSPYTDGTTACSSAQALSLLQNSFPGYTATPGKCPIH